MQKRLPCKERSPLRPRRQSKVPLGRIVTWCNRDPNAQPAFRFSLPPRSPRAEGASPAASMDSTGPRTRGPPTARSRTAPAGPTTRRFRRQTPRRMQPKTPRPGTTAPQATHPSRTGTTRRPTRPRTRPSRPTRPATIHASWGTACASQGICPSASSSRTVAPRGAPRPPAAPTPSAHAEELPCVVRVRAGWRARRRRMRPGHRCPPPDRAPVNGDGDVADADAPLVARSGDGRGSNRRVLRPGVLVAGDLHGIRIERCGGGPSRTGRPLLARARHIERCGGNGHESRLGALRRRPQRSARHLVGDGTRRERRRLRRRPRRNRPTRPGTPTSTCTRVDRAASPPRRS